MRFAFTLLALVVFLTFSGNTAFAQEWTFIRGDSNGDGKHDIADPIFNLKYMSESGPSFCLDAQDSNDDGVVDIADPIYDLGYLFSGGPAPRLVLASANRQITKRNADEPIISRPEALFALAALVSILTFCLSGS